MTGSTSLPASHYGYRTGFYRNHRRIEEPNPLMTWLDGWHARGGHVMVMPMGVTCHDVESTIDAILCAHHHHGALPVTCHVTGGGYDEVSGVLTIDPRGRLTRGEHWVVASTMQSLPAANVFLD